MPADDLALFITSLCWKMKKTGENGEIGLWKNLLLLKQAVPKQQDLILLKHGRKRFVPLWLILRKGQNNE